MSVAADRRVRTLLCVPVMLALLVMVTAPSAQSQSHPAGETQRDAGTAKLPAPTLLEAGERSATRLGSISNMAYADLISLVEANLLNFYVYLDEDSGLNHGFPSGFVPSGDNILINPGCVDDQNSSTGCSSDPNALDTQRGTVFSVTLTPPAGQFRGLNFEEPQNWEANGMPPSNAYDLTPASTVSFDARSPDGAAVIFGVGGCVTVQPFSISSAWTTFTIALSSLVIPGTDLPCDPGISAVHLLFMVQAVYPNQGTVLLDNIQFTPVPPRTSQDGETLSLPLSNHTYGVVPQTSNFPPDQVNRNPATVYESALTLLSLLNHGDTTDAQEIANAFDYALYHDNHGDFIPTTPSSGTGCFSGASMPQCGLHNAYDSGDIGLLNNQAAPAAGLAGDIRLAGFTVPTMTTMPPGFDLVLDGATGGNNAFALIGLLAAYRQFNDMTYLNDALVIANWIVGLQDSTGTGFGGYYHGYPDMGMIPKQLELDKSTENNADIFAALTLLAEIETGLGNSSAAAQWTGAANVAGNFVVAMYDSVNGRFNTGTVPLGTSPGPGVCPTGATMGNDVINVCDFLDSDSFSILGLAGSQQYGLYSSTQGDWQPAMQYVLNLPPSSFTQSIVANSMPFSGFDLVPAPPATGIAWEFTGQSVETCNYLDAVFLVTSFTSCAQTYIEQVAQAQVSAPFADGSSLVAATLNGENNPPHNLPPGIEFLPTPFQNISERLGVGATNWAIFADLGVNPLAFYPEATVSATSLTFPTQLVGMSSAAQTVKLTNPGSTALSITSISSSAEFPETNTCGTSVAAGATCSISASFKPMLKGTRTGTLTIKDNAPDGGRTISLTGTGTVVRIVPTRLNFGSVQVGSTSPPQTVTITNVGVTAINITGIGISGTDPHDFSISTKTCGSSLGGHASCTVNVVFSPTARGTRSATLSVQDNGGGSPQKVSLGGTGT